MPLATRHVNGKIESQIYLTPEQLKIIDFIDQVGRISARDVENILSSPKRTAQLQLQKTEKNKNDQGSRKRQSYFVYSKFIIRKKKFEIFYKNVILLKILSVINYYEL